MQTPSAPLTMLLQLAAQGERDALNRLFEALYPDLRRIAIRACGSAAQWRIWRPQRWCMRASCAW